MNIPHVVNMDARNPDLLADSAPAPVPGAGRPWLARRAGRTVAGGNVRLGADGEAGAVLAQAAGLPRPRLSGGGWLYGSRQLGDLARRRVAVRLRAADGGAAVERDGDRAAVAVHAARGRRRARSRPGQPRFLSALRIVAAVAVGGDRHHRHRSRRSDRHRHRPQPAVSHSAADRRDHHGRGRVSDSRAAGVRVSLDRGIRGGDAGR